MNKKIFVNVAVGFFVLIALAALFFLGFKASALGSFKPENTYNIKAIFGDVSGLGKDALVSVGGVQIGRVNGVKLLNNGMVEVNLDIDGSKKIPSDTGAQILTNGLLGERYIGLSLGTSNKFLANGDTLAKTGGSIVLEKMLQQFLGGGGGFYPDKFYKLKANFTDITGISLDTPVRQAGVQIGRVADIKLDQKTAQAVLTLEIASQYNEIPTDSSADIMSSSLIGGKFIAIGTGGDDTFMQDGDEFQATNSAMLLEKLIQQVVNSMTTK